MALKLAKTFAGLSLLTATALLAFKLFGLSATRKLAQSFKVQHKSGAWLQAEIKSGDIILFDTRGPLEFKTSHLAGANRVDWQIEADDFLRAHQQTIQGRDLVFYCSVGLRSSSLAERLGQTLRQVGARSVSNLDGGIFLWLKEGRALAGGKTVVHNYNWFWGMLAPAGKK